MKRLLIGLFALFSVVANAQIDTASLTKEDPREFLQWVMSNFEYLGIQGKATEYEWETSNRKWRSLYDEDGKLYTIRQLYNEFVRAIHEEEWEDLIKKQKRRRSHKQTTPYH